MGTLIDFGSTVRCALKSSSTLEYVPSDVDVDALADAEIDWWMLAMIECVSLVMA